MRTSAKWTGSYDMDRRHTEWTPEEDDELIDLVKEQELTLCYDKKLAWYRIGIQLDRPGYVCRERWMCLRRRKNEVVLPLAYYRATDGEDRVVLWYIGQDSSYVERPGI